MLGIDIGTYSVKVAVVKKSGKKATIDKVYTEIIPPEAREADALPARQRLITNLIERAGRAEKTIALSVPTSSTILKTIRVASDLSDEELEGEVQLALIDWVPFPLDQVYIDFVGLGKQADNPALQEIFVAATKRETVDAAVEHIKVKNIRHKIVDIEATAIGLLIEKMKGEYYRDVYAVVDIGYLSTNTYVYAKDELLFSRSQQIGGQHLTELIAETMGLSEEEAEKRKLTALGTIPQRIINHYLNALAEQISTSIELYLSEAERIFDVVYLTGGGSHLMELIPTLKRHFPEQEVAFLPINDSLKVNAQTDDKTIDLLSAVAIGLALRT